MAKRKASDDISTRPSKIIRQEGNGQILSGPNEINYMHPNEVYICTQMKYFLCPNEMHRSIYIYCNATYMYVHLYSMYAQKCLNLNLNTQKRQRQ